MKEAKECADYFRSKAAYDRIMTEIYRNFRKFGKAKGNVVISDASMEECYAANEIVGPKEPFLPPVIKFHVSDFEKGLKKTRFGSADLKDITEIYFGKTIVTRKAVNESSAAIRSAVLNSAREKNAGRLCEEWLCALISQKSFGYKSIAGEINTSPDNAEKILGNVCEAINSRENAEPVQLAVMSAEITGDPHYFDNTRTAGRLLLKGLAFTAEMPERGCAEDEKKIYGEFGIEPDNISGMTAAVGVRLYRSGMREHPAFKAFADNGEICLISMANLLDICGADADGKTVIAVENPMVFSALSSTAAEHGCGLLCTYGQLKLSGIRLLQMLADSGCKILYAGDFDPEGLQIADRILCRFSEYDVHSWHMTERDYISIEKGEAISEKRLNKLKSIRSPELVPAAEILAAQKRAAYQELLISQMADDISHGLTDAVSHV